MPAKNNGNGNGHAKLNGHKRTQGRAEGDTQLQSLDLRERAIEMYTAGKSVQEIAKAINRSEPTIYAYIQDARLELIRKKKDYYDERIALLLDQQLDTIATQHRLLNDDEFNRTADPERLKAIGTNLGILTDKCFLLLATAANRRTQQPEQSQDSTGTGSN